MANLDLIVYNSNMLSDQMANRVNAIINGYGKFDIQTKLALIQHVFSSASRYYEEHGSSEANAQEYEIFHGPPIADDWNELQRAIVNDLGVLYREHRIAYDIVENAKNYNYAETAFLMQSIKKLKNEVSTFANLTNVEPGKVKWYAGDDFHDTSRVDLSNTNASVLVGTVELARDGKKDF